MTQPDISFFEQLNNKSFWIFYNRKTIIDSRSLGFNSAFRLNNQKNKETFLNKKSSKRSNKH